MRPTRWNVTDTDLELLATMLAEHACSASRMDAPMLTEYSRRWLDRFAGALHAIEQEGLGFETSDQPFEGHATTGARAVRRAYEIRRQHPVHVLVGYDEAGFEVSPGADGLPPIDDFARLLWAAPTLLHVAVTSLEFEWTFLFTRLVYPDQFGMGFALASQVLEHDA